MPLAYLNAELTILITLVSRKPHRSKDLAYLEVMINLVFCPEGRTDRRLFTFQMRTQDIKVYCTIGAQRENAEGLRAHSDGES